MLLLFELLSWSCALATLAAFVYKVPRVRLSTESAALFALATYFFFNSMAYWVDLEISRKALLELFKFPNITVIIVQVSVLVLTAAQQVAIVYLVLPPQEANRAARRQIIGFGLAIGLLVLLFASIRPGRVSTVQETVYLNIQDGDYALYMSYYLTVCAIGRFQTVLFSFRYARTIREFWLRLGMWSVAGGSALILAYCAVRYWQILALHTDLVTVQPWKFLFWLIADIGTLLQMLGWTVPSWGPKLGALSRWLGNYHDYLRLGPLWRAVSQAAPEITLEPARHRLLTWIPPRRLEYHLYRRVIEIRDGQLILARAADPIAIHRLEQARGMGHEAMFEAAMLKSALRGPVERQVHEGMLPNRRPADVSLPQEISQLTHVSGAFRSLGSRRRAHRGRRRLSRRGLPY